MGKKIIICGATSGIGREVAMLCVSDGYTVGIMGRRSNLLEEIKAKNPEKIFIKTVDVNAADAEKKLAELIDDMGGIDSYFHVSGVGFQNIELERDKEMQTVETNCLGFTRMITAAFNYFAQRGHGHIAAISSVASTKGMGSAASYSASKRFQANYLQALSQLTHMRKLDIKITDIRPGFVDTDLLSGKKYPMLMTKEYAAKLIYKALDAKHRVKIINWKYAVLVFFWRQTPRCIWERMNIKHA